MGDPRLSLSSHSSATAHKNQSKWGLHKGTSQQSLSLSSCSLCRLVHAKKRRHPIDRASTIL
ncbi:hypothetical protein EJB05_23563, partial [Eragrostis curvula]